MPSALVKSFAKKAGKSVDTVEEYWIKAKALAKEQYNVKEDSPRFYSIATGILKKMLKVDEKFDNVFKSVIEEGDLAGGVGGTSVPSDSELYEFFSENPTPSDEELHSWAEENGFSVEKTEEAVYVMASAFCRFMNGGKAKEKGVTAASVDPNQLMMGMEVEKEHSPDERVREKIALDHLAEMENYYTELQKMESGNKHGIEEFNEAQEKSTVLTQFLSALANTYNRFARALDPAGFNNEVQELNSYIGKLKMRLENTKREEQQGKRQQQQVAQQQQQGKTPPKSVSI